MFPLIGSLMSGASSILGSWFSSETSAKNTQAQIQAQQQMQQQSQQFNAEEAEKTRAYQTQMSNTAFQRASQDMKSAGLNPMIMAGGGGGASTPSGATASTGTPTVPMPQNTHPLGRVGEAVTQAISSAIQMKTMDKMTDEIANLQADNSRIKAVADNVVAATATEKERARKTEAETSNIRQDTTRAKLDRARQEWEAIKYLDLSNIPDAARKTGNISSWGAGKIGDVLAPITSSALGVARLLPKRSTGQRSGVDSSGKSFDEFWENRTGFSR